MPTKKTTVIITANASRPAILKGSGRGGSGTGTGQEASQSLQPQAGVLSCRKIFFEKYKYRMLNYQAILTKTYIQFLIAWCGFRIQWRKALRGRAICMLYIVDLKRYIWIGVMIAHIAKPFCWTATCCHVTATH